MKSRVRFVEFCVCYKVHIGFDAAGQGMSVSIDVYCIYFDRNPNITEPVIESISSNMKFDIMADDQRYLKFFWLLIIQVLLELHGLVTSGMSSRLYEFQ
jgi:hypothetical protein